MSKTNPHKPDQEPSFEQAVAELEELIERIESGQIGLEACLTQYERGMKLIARCQSVLGQAQKKIAELSVTSDGSLRRQGSTPEDDADQDPSLHDEAEGLLG